MDSLVAAAEAEERRIHQRTMRAWADWCAERHIRQFTLFQHLGRGRKVPVVKCRHCGERHI